MSKKFKIILVCVVIAFIVLVPISWYLGYKSGSIKEEDKVPTTENRDTNKDDKDNKEDNQEKDMTPYEKFLQQAKEEREDKIILSSSNYEIKMTKNGAVYASVESPSLDTPDLVDRLVETNIVKYFVVRVGMGDVGDGRTLIFIKEDGTISSLSLDFLLLSCEVKINRNYAFKNIIEVYDKITAQETEYEPAGYSAFAKDIDGKEIDITDIILVD